MQQFNWEHLGPKDIHNLKNTLKRPSDIVVMYFWVNFFSSLNVCQKKNTCWNDQGDLGEKKNVWRSVKAVLSTPVGCTITLKLTVIVSALSVHLTYTTDNLSGALGLIWVSNSLGSRPELEHSESFPFSKSSCGRRVF